MAGKGVREIVKGAMRSGHDRIRGHWKVEVEPRGSSLGFDEQHLTLKHYGTKMLEWKTTPRADSGSGEFTGRYDLQITGTWTGWGSVSDQAGVNAALSELGSPMRYSRDTRGGGPRINPRRHRRR